MWLAKQQGVENVVGFNVGGRVDVARASASR